MVGSVDVRLGAVEVGRKVGQVEGRLGCGLLR